MNQLFEHLRIRVEETKTALEEARKAALEARNREESLATDLGAYQRALDAEKRRDGLLHPGSVPSNPSTPTDQPAHEASASDLNKTERLREFLRRNSATGMKPSEIIDAFEHEGIEIKHNYVYAMLQRQKSKGEVRVRRGRYFPKEVSETATASERA